MASDHAAPTTEPATHAALGASGAARWMACPGSIRLSADIDSPDTAYTLAGTAAHALAERCLREHADPQDYKDQSMLPGETDSLVDDDMIAAVRVYLEYTGRVLALCDFHAIEQRLSLAPLGVGVAEQMFGTADFVAYRVATRTLLVADYKHGAGVPVDVQDNAQLRYYALAALVNLEALSAGRYRAEQVARVRIAVIQPRAPHADGSVRVDTLDPAVLTAWGRDKLLPAAERTQQPDAPLAPGSHCRFCPAAGVCPAQRDRAMDNAQMVFAGHGAKPVTAAAEHLTDYQMRQILDAAKDIRAWLTHVENRVKTRLGQGGSFNGYKLVAARATRRWADTEHAADVLRERFGLDDDAIHTPPALLPPAQIEKRIGKGKNSRAALAELVTAESTGTSLAPESDKRPALGNADERAQQAFAHVCVSSSRDLS